MFQTVFRAILFCCFSATVIAYGNLEHCITWPNYVTPNDTQPCTCTYSPTTTHFLRWNTSKGVIVAQGRPGQSVLPLPLKNLPRTSSSGRPLSCYLETGEENTTVTVGSYTPYLAYGPDNVTIVSSQTFIPDDGSNMTLTCMAKVSPEPQFHWEGHPTGSVIFPGCRRYNDTFTETLTFNPRGFKDGYIIRCRVSNTLPNWPMTASAQFLLRLRPSKPQTVSLQLFLVVIFTLTAMLMTSLALFFRQWRKNQTLVCERPSEETERKQRVGREDRETERDREREPLLDSLHSDHTYSSAGDSVITHLENPSIQTEYD